MRSVWPLLSGSFPAVIPIHSALYLLVNFVSLAVLYVTLEAQFLAAAQVIIYAGGIVILILFVIMLIGSEKIETRARSPHLDALCGHPLGGDADLQHDLFLCRDTQRQYRHVDHQWWRTRNSGYALFTQYILPFEMAAVLLLVALLGALLLARYPKTEQL